MCRAVPGTNGFWEPWIVCDLHIMSRKLFCLNSLIFKAALLDFSNCETTMERKQMKIQVIDASVKFIFI